MQIQVVDNPEARRYEALADGSLAGFIDYRIRPGQINLIHTQVEDAFAGKGVASVLVKRTLEKVRAEGLGLLPICPFVAAYLKRHPEYVDLVPAEQRSRFGLPEVAEPA